MYDFLGYILYELKNKMALALLILVPLAAALGIFLLIRKKRGKEIGGRYWRRWTLYFLLGGYLIVLLAVTLLRMGYGWREISLHPFRAWREAWNDFSFKSWSNVMLNIAMFVPAGFLPAVLWEKLRKWYRMIPLGSALSLLIELAQLAIARGICDVDDWIANSLGTVLGFFLAMAWIHLRDRKGFLRYCGLSLVMLILIGSPFGLYELKTYGNLPQAPAYKLNTRETQWVLHCVLPQEADRVTVYQTDALTPEECLQVARQIAAALDYTVAMESYYQDEGYFHLDPHGILRVFYRGGGWELSDFSNREEERWAQWQRAEVEQALSGLPVQIPETAVFTQEEDGWYAFSCDGQQQGEILRDGTLRCRIREDGKIQEIETDLLSYVCHSDTAILSAEEAWERIKKGYFRDEIGFERSNPPIVSVSDCRLVYLIDTKGFYRPVWEFTVSADTGYGADKIFIPA